MKENLKTIAQNKKAFHDYFLEESFEAGIELCGTEVKSIRQGRVNLKDSWCSIVDGEMLVNGMHISPYEQGNIFNKDPMRVRRLLMHKREIMRLFGLVKQDGYSLIPVSLYFKGSRVKVQVGLCKGKKLYDKRSDLAARAAKRAHWPSTPLPWGRQTLGSLTQRYFSWHFMGDLLLCCGHKKERRFSSHPGRKRRSNVGKMVVVTACPITFF